MVKPSWDKNTKWVAKSHKRDNHHNHWFRASTTFTWLATRGIYPYTDTKWLTHCVRCSEWPWRLLIPVDPISNKRPAQHPGECTISITKHDRVNSQGIAQNSDYKTKRVNQTAKIEREHSTYMCVCVCESIHIHIYAWLCKVLPFTHKGGALVAFATKNDIAMSSQFLHPDPTKNIIVTNWFHLQILQQIIANITPLNPHFQIAFHLLHCLHLHSPQEDTNFPTLKDPSQF